MVHIEPPKRTISQCVCVCLCVCVLSCVQLFATPQTITHQQ